MFSRRRLSLTVVTVVCLIAASGASAVSTAIDGPFAWTGVLGNAAVPTVTITGKPSNPSGANSASFVFTASEPSTFECKLDGAAFEPCTSPKPYTGLGAGLHTFEVKATNQTAETGTATFTWTIDVTAPTVTITVKPPNQSNDTSPTFGFTASEASTFRCGLDPATLAACTSPKTFANLAAGAYTFLVRATDGVGNVGAASYSWTIDTSPPTTSITAKPSNPSNVESPSFQFAASEIATFECKIDGAAFAACTTPKIYTALADGAHTFRVKARDRAGNPGPEATYTWMIDTTVPTATITLKPSSSSNTRSPTFAFIASESGTFTCRIDAGSFASCTSPTTYSSLADGPHTFAVRATDSAGNTGPEASYAWTIETRAPTAALASAPAGLSNSSAATFAFVADEPSSFDCSVDGRAFEPCSSPATYHGLGDGAHAFSVRAKDAVGNLSAPAAHTWAIDTTAPETTLAAAPTSGPTTAATFAYTASENATFECRLDGSAFTLCGSPKSYGGLSQGDHQFQVRAIDRAGNVDATPSLHGWKIAAPAAKKVASALLSPKAGARVTRAPLLVWRRVSRAGYYNVQIFRGKRKVLSAWPTKARLQLRMRWKYLGRQERLTPGRYRWFIWPGYGNPRRYGTLLGQSSFVVGRATRR